MVKQQQDLQDLQQELLCQEVDQALYDEKLEKLWKKYHKALFVLVVLAILSTMGVEMWRNYRQNRLLKESNTYEAAAVRNAQGDSETALATYEQLAEASSDYKTLAQMRIVGILQEQGKRAEALQKLQALQADSSVNETLHDVITLSLVRMQLTENQVVQQNLLTPYLKPESSWYGVAVELQALIFLKQQEKAQAVSLIEQALPQTTGQIHDRLQAFLNTLKK